MRFKISCILITLFTIYACNLKVEKKVEVNSQSIEHNGHDYIIFCYGNNETSIVHDPDCKKCYERYD